MKNIKQELHKICSLTVEEKIKSVQERLASLNEAMKNETKSSVGDKYETGRAMIQNEKEQLMKQLSKSLELRTKLQQINPSKKPDKVALGSLVVCNSGSYYISVGIGKIVLDKQAYFAISVISPIGKLLLNKKIGDEVFFREKKISIMELG